METITRMGNNISGETNVVSGPKIVIPPLAPKKFEGYFHDRIGDKHFAVVHLTGTSYRKLPDTHLYDFIITNL